MEIQNGVITTRLKRILNSFLQESFATTNNVYFEKLITHLSAKGEKGEYLLVTENEFLLQAPFAMDWVDKCISIIEDDFTKVNPQVISFMFNFCALLALNEWKVIDIRERKIMDRIRTIRNRDLHQFTPSIKLGTIRLVSVVVSYSLGLAYLRNTKGWHFLIDYCNKDHTLYVVREARKVIYDLLYKFSVKTYDEEIVLDILTEILRPILENVYDEHSEKIMIIVDDSELQHKLASTLDLLSYIFQQTLESEEKTNLAHRCSVHHQLEKTLWKLTEMTQNQYFLEKVMTTLSSYNFAVLVYDKWVSGQIAPENFNQFGITFFNMMKFCIMRKDCLNFLKLAELNHILWKKLGQRAPKEILIENERVTFENQLITFHLLPLLFMLKAKEFQCMELFDNYIKKLFEISCDHTLRICYSYRDILLGVENTSQPLLANLAYKSIHGILSMQHILEREQAVLVFQAMMYSLKDYIIKSKVDPDSQHSCVEGADLFVERPNVLYAALIGMQNLIRRYKLTWKESIETICVLNFMLVILENPNLSSRLAVQALKLGQLAIEHFLSPNMALLVDNLKGSALVDLGPLIIKRFHDTTWEVRDSTLELVNSIATISRMKYPAFQQFLADHKIGAIVYQMAKNDCELYVRASAFKCLSQMIAINVLWETDLNQIELIEHLFFVLCNESEGIVRKEAVITLSRIYDLRKIPNQYKDTLYSTFAHCVVDDLHWEVKVSALHFWEVEIQKQFTNQGMIDGTFPTVTFSKEHKKIVTLTAKEVNVRIVKVFNELSQRGCLGVLLKCLNDDCDLEVIKVAVRMVRRLFEHLKKYDYESIIVESGSSNHKSAQSNTPTVVSISAVEPVVEEHNSSAADAIIESILSDQDINLLIAAYEAKSALNGEEVEPNRVPADFYKKFASISGKDFIEAITNLDLDKLLHNENEWFLCAESFVSLLDDILLTVKATDEGRIFADCY